MICFTRACATVAEGRGMLEKGSLQGYPLPKLRGHGLGMSWKHCFTLRFFTSLFRGVGNPD